ncbi:myo-inositol 2-dehydrogenase [Verticillium dahliae VdLs.17]|uniref:Myo-inositol 2-dehydrogenase n=1 Tax=Verticillium dahliae (strain VdLs.17 / ATCC MYA-4575 / FGSC 10137) TaxID=498257 RepID=G2XDH3_VERDV|nr:myo-inositol 2-dehydrogenase [Verticillium dahliae VdLs.17]EGY17041.1 myo-inositol 2-dehydrogenase [Verticillium dahliae VdLs.17]KAH6696080.1 myo-inositol 2-dehydrogenase [Verticillium dahliae]
MSSWFRITYLCDFSEAALKHCAAKIPGTVKTTRNPELLCTSEDVDVILVASSDEYHAEHALAALKHHKHVLVEKSLALTKKDIGTIAEAERHSRGSVMVGYMRRYAAPVEDAIREVGGMDKVFYAPVRDIIGANLTFQDMNKLSMVHLQSAEMFQSQKNRLWRGECFGSSLGYPFWNDLFKYPGFTVSYESGIDNNPRFDAHLEGLPVTMHIAENYNGTYKEATIRKTYEDPYTHELKEWWNSTYNGLCVLRLPRFSANAASPADTGTPGALTAGSLLKSVTLRDATGGVGSGVSLDGRGGHGANG